MAFTAHLWCGELPVDFIVGIGIWLLLNEGRFIGLRFFAAQLYEASELTYVQAAEMCGYTKWTFASVLVGFIVNYFQYSYEEFAGKIERNAWFMIESVVINDTSCLIVLDKI